MKALIGLLLFVSPSAWANASDKKTLTLRADVWCPFNCEPDAKQPGYMVEIAKRAFKDSKIEVEYKTLTWPRAIVDARDNKIDGIIGAATTDAPDFVYPDESLGLIKNCFYTLSDSKWTYKDSKSFSEISIGTIKGYSYGDPFDAYVSEQEKLAEDRKKDKTKKASSGLTENIQVVSGDAGLELNYKKLQAKRIGAFIEEQNVLKSFMQTKKIAESTLKNVGCVKEDKVYIAFGPTNPNAKAYAKLLSDTVSSMRKDGSLKKLLDEYGLQDWVK
jgi:polar amino acid transport system substrate-binding protein